VKLGRVDDGAREPVLRRAAVNRICGRNFFGTGLIEPVDDMVGDGHVASHPELLAELARAFAAAASTQIPDPCHHRQQAYN